MLLAFVPSSFWAYFPIINPKKVKKELIMEKIIEGKQDVLIIFSNPMPVIRESILTKMAKKIILGMVSFKLSFLFCFKS
jgi:hypothetical protein